MKNVYRAVRWAETCASGYFFRFINGTKGVISLFLAILMVPFVSVAGVLINAARVNSAIAVFDEALCNASNSTLGTYDAFLKERFGLLAMAQDGVGGSYSGSRLIEDTFAFYMQKNLEVLSNAYLDATCEAAGVYPLADPDILLTEVMEYGKYTIPTKIAADVLPLDTILSDLTKSFNVVGDMLNVASSSADMVVSLDTCQTDMQTLKDQLEKCAASQKDYDARYPAFSSAAAQYNSAVGSMKTEVGEAWETVHDAEEKVQNARDALDAAGENDNISELQAALSAAEAELQEAEEALEETVDTHRTALSTKKQEAESRRTEYLNALTDLRKNLEIAKANAIKAQESTREVREQGAELIGNVVKTANDGAKASYKKNTETLSELQKASEQSGNSQAAYLWEQEAKKNKENEVKWDNMETVVDKGSDSVKSAADKVAEFSDEALAEKFDVLLKEIDEKIDEVNAYEIPPDGMDPQRLTADNYTSFNNMASTDHCYRKIELPKNPHDIEKMLDDLGSEVANSSLIAAIKAMIGFIRAMLAVNLWVNPDLKSSLKTDSFDAVNGLPSQKSRTDYPLTSPYESSDKQQSDHYKSVMGGYSANALNTGSINSFISTVEEIMSDIEAISNACNEMKWYNVLFKLGEILKRTISIGGKLTSLMGQIVQVIATAVYGKVLLAGYLGYNTANRTTYTGSALTGADYDLPSEGTEGKCLYGAETEYIILGKESEATNQTYIFFIIYIIRALVNIPVILMNGEIQTMATAAGAISFGVATPIVYFLYILVEALVDSLFLVNGGDIPMVKTVAYLTPSGVGDLVEGFTSLKMTDAQTTKARGELAAVMSKVSAGISDRKADVDFKDFGKTFAEELDTFGDASETTTGKVNALFRMNYTHTLMLIMLFCPAQDMVKRLGDIIQMEATYKGGYDFNLDQSFTYLRASGSFTTNEFIRLSDSGTLNSANRVIYRGY